MLNLSLFDLNGLLQTATTGWIGPVFLIIVAGVSITFLIRREIRQLLIFLVIAAIVGLLVYGGQALFGQQGNLKNAANTVANNVNVIVPTLTSHVSSVFTSIGNFIH